VTGAARPLLLIHGAWHGSWFWRRVEPLLRDAGVRHLSLELPLSSYDDDVAATRAAAAGLAAEGGEGIVACGHSYGGRVLSTAALAPTPIGHLIYLAAPMPDERMLEYYANAARFRGEGVPDFEPAWRTFYSSLDRDTAAEAYAHLRPQPSGAGAMLGLDNRPWRQIETTYVVCTEDRALPPDVQRQMAANADHVAEIESDHSPFLSVPAALAEILIAVCLRGAPVAA